MARTRRNWTPEEDELLRVAVNTALAESRPLLWRELAKSVPGRSNKDCRRRWWNSLADGTAKGPWSEEEDERLIEAVRKHGTSWSRVAQVVRSRNPDQCSSHWSQVLNPTINYCDWIPEEDAQLLRSVLTHGTNWTKIAASHVPKRTTLALKNRYSTLRLRHKKLKDQGSSACPGPSPVDVNGAFTTMLEPEEGPKLCQNPRRRGREDAKEGSNEDKDGKEPDGGYGDDENRDSSLPSAQCIDTPSSMNACPANCHQRDSELPWPGTWAEYGDRERLPSTPASSLRYETMTPPLPSDASWLPTAAGQMVDASFLSQTYSSSQIGSPVGALSSAIPGGPGVQGNLPYISQGIEGNIALSGPPTYQPFGRAGLRPSNNDQLPHAEVFPTAPADPKRSSYPLDQAQCGLRYQVRLSMVCTGAQMESAVASLREIGVAAAVEIELAPPEAPHRPSEWGEEAVQGG
ncbi:Myb-related protein B [Madurella mycetomatis]|uniref:Myb-related protein B n=1 Tax=Madurella mycetomatis TaxID=100816 RepID=A0A175WCC6_9PEZI|nr:Myb-related protein B [Madurella mycetomatis]